jgi:hypothetical protein
MAWEWSKVDEKGLARFVTDDAVSLVTLPINRHDLIRSPDSRYQIVEAVYNALTEKDIRYTPEKYHPSAAIQPIRTPAEILEAPREGTCLDLAALFCGLCLGNELLPLLVVIEGHALAAVSLTHGLREWNALDRQERELFEHEPLTDSDRLRELIDNDAYLAVECTGFARSKNLPGSVPEGVGRMADGLLPFDRAISAGREQLDRSNRPFRFALDIAVAHYYWRIDETMHRTTEVSSKLSTSVLDERLDETLRLYLSKVFKDDQYARLDQAGEIDPDRSTLLHQVFVDLEVKARGGKQPGRLGRRQATLFEESQHLVEDPLFPDDRKALSAMKCFLGEQWPKIVIIGGPGQGKSTLGQYLAQVHRKILLKGPEELELLPRESSEAKEPGFVPDTPRVPFRVVLKYFAQWLTDSPHHENVEAYLAEQIGRGAARSVSSEEVQTILRACACLVIFDGLDEVTEPDLRDRLLNQVETFLGRTEQLGANLQVIATSRPTGYSEQFDSEQFWHLDLQPMSVKKVRDYAQRWVRIKVPVEEEQRRVLDTLEECLQEEHTRSLLTTPLQVTIVLIIIKDGGRPPAQREALFHEYWGTIFRREKAKAKGVIRTEESLLFDLHSYLGYLLHRRAASENVRSLLPTTEFEHAVRGFLRARDSRSLDEAIGQQATQMVTEARDRLWLLVEPESGLFGFELRSLQEFFAAAYLAQTARDTQQRFDRLKAIARSEHWRNASLFFAGRIVRNFSGEAANVLELVCRPIDRDIPDRYLRRGAWLALDIAADGAFAANRDLQYNAVEYALTVLDNIVMSGDKEHLQAALRRLSPEDRRDIVGPLLRQKLAFSASSCLATAVDAYGEFVDNQETFIQGLEALLTSGWPECVRSALNLGFRHRADPRWLATQLEHYWTTWSEEEIYTFWSWWTQDPEHVEQLLSAWAPSEACIHHLLSNFIPTRWHFGPSRSHIPLDWYFSRLQGAINKLADEPVSLVDQMIAALYCCSVLSMPIEGGPPMYSERIKGGSTEVAFIDLEKFHKRRMFFVRKRVSSTQLKRLLEYAVLIPHLKVCLWSLYWMVYEPHVEQVSAFVKEVQAWIDSGIVSEDTPFSWQERIWPLLGLAVERQIKGDSKAIERLQPYLNRAQEIAFNEQVLIAVRELAQRASGQAWAEFMLGLRIGEVSGLPELTPLAERLEITVAELVRIYVLYWSEGSWQKYSSTELRRAFSAIEMALTQSQKPWPQFWPIMDAKWSVDQETLTQGKRLLTTMIENLPQQSTALGWLISLFLKMLTSDQNILSLAPSLLSTIGALPEAERKIPSWWLEVSVGSVPRAHLSKLAEYIRHEDNVIRRGARVFWRMLVDSILESPPDGYASGWRKLKSLRFDWQIGLSLIGDTDVTEKTQGISLLTLSDFPITNVARRTELLTALAQAQERSEITAWARLLRVIPISKSKASVWRELLESILAQPRVYSSAVLTAAMERYATLAGKADLNIIGDEVALGLAAVRR